MKVISRATLNNQKIGQNIHMNQESRQIMHTSKDIRNNVRISISIAFIFIFSSFSAVLIQTDVNLNPIDQNYYS
jgi:hypothetical protein